MCPNCGHWADIWSYVPFGRAVEYEDQLAPVRKCRECRHVFALREGD